MPRAGQRTEILRLERGALGIGVGQPVLHLLDLAVEEAQRRLRVVAVVRQILVDEDSISLSTICLASLGLEADAVISNRLFCCATILMLVCRPATRSAMSCGTRHGVGEIGAAHDLFQIDRAGQRLADRVDVVLLLLRIDADLRRQHWPIWTNTRALAS